MAGDKGIPGVAAIGDPQEDAFLRAIIEHPDDDTNRLVYADWLQERGNPFGEFIRCQVEAARKGTAPAQKGKFKKRADELLQQHQWLPAYFDRKETKVQRGFATTLRFDYDQDIPKDAELAKLAALPFFALTGMSDSAGVYEGPEFSILVRLPRLGCMGKLDWSSGWIGSEENDSDEPERPQGALLLSSPHLAGLRELALAGCGLRNSAIAALAKNPAVASLRKLNLGSAGGMEVSGNFFDDKGLKALCESPYLGEVEELDLGDSGISDKGLKFLCESPAFPKLKKLDLTGVCLTGKGYLTLAGSPFAARLEALCLGHGYYQDEDTWPGEVGARALVESPHLEKIKRLNLHEGELSAETRAALRQRFGKRLKMRD